MPIEPGDCENGELQPDPNEPGGTLAEREHAQRIQRHNRPITATTEPESTPSEPKVS